MLDEIADRVYAQIDDVQVPGLDDSERVMVIIKSGLTDILREAARAECKYCKRGDFPSRRRYTNISFGYSHRVPEGKHGGKIWMQCRANEIWKLMEASYAH